MRTDLLRHRAIHHGPLSSLSCLEVALYLVQSIEICEALLGLALQPAKVGCLGLCLGLLDLPVDPRVVVPQPQLSRLGNLLRRQLIRVAAQSLGHGAEAKVLPRSREECLSRIHIHPRPREIVSSQAKSVGRVQRTGVAKPRERRVGRLQRLKHLRRRCLAAARSVKVPAKVVLLRTGASQARKSTAALKVPPWPSPEAVALGLCADWRENRPRAQDWRSPINTNHLRSTLA